jgi:hypothetical protein
MFTVAARRIFRFSRSTPAESFDGICTDGQHHRI